MDAQIVKTAEFLLLEWKALIDASNGDYWYMYDKRRAYQDALIAMQSFGLVAEYDVVTCKVVLEGRQDKSSLVFVATGKSVVV